MRIITRIGVATLAALVTACGTDPGPASSLPLADGAGRQDTADMSTPDHSAPDATLTDGATADTPPTDGAPADAAPDAGTPDAGQSDTADADSTLPDAGADTAPDAGPPDSAAPDSAAPDSAPDTSADAGPSPFPAVDKWGPWPVGTRVMKWIDAKRGRAVTTRLWYPVKEKDGVGSAVYFDLVISKVHGKARKKGTVDPAAGKLPVVLFSHGFKGIGWQSYDFTEYLASHGFVVAAPDHAGNTLFDFSASKETESKSALERPRDILFVYDRLVALNKTPGSDFTGALDLSRVAVAGHSFGGYTALVNAGAEVDVDAAKKACKTTSNMLCKGGYMDAWPDGSTIKADKAIPGLKAAICLAPGFHVAFGDAGMKKVSVPVIFFGGTLDTTTPIKDDLDPLYQAAPAPKAEVIIEGASHMSYTNICSLPPAQAVPQLKEMCVKPGLIDVKAGFAITNALAVAFLRRTLCGDKAQSPLFETAWAKALFPKATVKSQGL